MRPDSCDAQRRTHTHKERAPLNSCDAQRGSSPFPEAGDTRRGQRRWIECSRSFPPTHPPTHPPSLPPSFARSPAHLLFSSPPYRGLNRDAAGTDPSAGGEVLLVRTSIPRSMSTLTRSSRRNASSLSCPSQLDCRRNQRAVDKPFDICCADASTSSFRDVTSFLLDQSPQ